MAEKKSLNKLAFKNRNPALWYAPNPHHLLIILIW
jgi:hypothetical protein